jgi:toxin FitB
MIILDTNVLSALMREPPDKSLMEWLDGLPSNSIWITSVTVLEIRFGLQILPTGARRTDLTAAFERLLATEMKERIASFDATAAQHAAHLRSARHLKGRPVDLRDTMIAGIALAHHATLVTRNKRHFADVAIPVIDPWFDLGTG